MAKKVSGEQMEELFAFTRKHYVEYYDLQLELADHMANAIEERWTTDLTLDFNTLKNQEFKKFGIFGFMEVVEQRQIALTKRYYNLIWSYFKEFFKLPRIVLTLVLIFLVYKILEFGTIAYSIMITIVLVITVYKFIAVRRIRRKKIKQTGKKWLFEEIIMRCGGVPVMFFFPYQIFQIPFDTELGAVANWVMSILLVSFALYQYTILYIIPSKAEEHLMATCPEYNLKFQD
ncbi:hypothetical protein D3C87_171260 [compost metagenome]